MPWNRRFQCACVYCSCANSPSFTDHLWRVWVSESSSGSPMASLWQWTVLALAVETGLRRLIKTGFQLQFLSNLYDWTLSFSRSLYFMSFHMEHSPTSPDRLSSPALAPLPLNSPHLSHSLKWTLMTYFGWCHRWPAMCSLGRCEGLKAANCPKHISA